MAFYKSILGRFLGKSTGGYITHAGDSKGVKFPSLWAGPLGSEWLVESTVVNVLSAASTAISGPGTYFVQSSAATAYLVPTPTKGGKIEIFKQTTSSDTFKPASTVTAIGFDSSGDGGTTLTMAGAGTAVTLRGLSSTAWGVMISQYPSSASVTVTISTSS